MTAPSLLPPGREVHPFEDFRWGAGRPGNARTVAAPSGTVSRMSVRRTWRTPLLPALSVAIDDVDDRVRCFSGGAPDRNAVDLLSRR